MICLIIFLDPKKRSSSKGSGNTQVATATTFSNGQQRLGESSNRQRLIQKVCESTSTGSRQQQRQPQQQKQI